MEWYLAVVDMTMMGPIKSLGVYTHNVWGSRLGWNPTESSSEGAAIA